jgi:hypothetical protein
MDRSSITDIFRGVSGVNMLRTAIVPDLGAGVVSVTPAKSTDRCCFIR